MFENVLFAFRRKFNEFMESRMGRCAVYAFLAIIAMYAVYKIYTGSVLWSSLYVAVLILCAIDFYLLRRNARRGY
jgi:hypothetical protein